MKDSDQERRAASSNFSMVPVLISIITSLTLLYAITYNFFFFRVLDSSLLELLTISDHFASALRSLPIMLFFFFIKDIAEIELFGASERERIGRQLPLRWKLFSLIMAILFVLFTLLFVGPKAGWAAFLCLVFASAAVDISGGIAGMELPKPRELVGWGIIFWVGVAGVGTIHGYLEWQAPFSHSVVVRGEERPIEANIVRRMSAGSVMVTSEGLSFVPRSNIVLVRYLGKSRRNQRPLICRVSDSHFFCDRFNQSDLDLEKDHVESDTRP